ncbi:hypothetical protein [Rhizohabitans arisaemae]|uniref:hypothetical protein n=1 Tax=Rhizohabitans arisaemae TaxID=2720610 RepID=UPI0024B1B4B8|nr:hypothetical protein [Rhizohabitans arisaemae]
MRRTQEALALAVLSLVSAGTLIVSPAHAAATKPAGCPTPTKAEVKRSHDGTVDRPPRGATAIAGVRVNHIPKGFSHGSTLINKGDGISDYSYVWNNDRKDADPKNRNLWVRVVCWKDADKLSRLKDAPIILGTFTHTKTAKIGGRKVLTKEGDGALGRGRYVGWVARKGVVITVMASPSLVPELDKIVKGIRLL